MNADEMDAQREDIKRAFRKKQAASEIDLLLELLGAIYGGEPKIDAERLVRRDITGSKR